MLFFTQILQQGGLLLVETMTLLIADSSEEFCNSLIDALQGNYRIQTCRTGKEALEILRTLHHRQKQSLCPEKLLSRHWGIFVS